MAPKSTTAKKAPAPKKETVKKAPAAKKAVAPKKATATKKAPAAKKKTVKKAPATVKKETASKAGETKKAPAVKMETVKKTATVKKAPAAKKVSSTKMDIDDHLMTILVDERDIKLFSEVKDSASVILLKDLQQHEQTKKVKNLIKKFLVKDSAPAAPVLDQDQDTTMEDIVQTSKESI